jgi:hypothetical protein
MTTITASWMDRPGSAISNPLPLCAFKFDIGRRAERLSANAFGAGYQPSTVATEIS